MFLIKLAGHRVIAKAQHVSLGKWPDYRVIISKSNLTEQAACEIMKVLGWPMVSLSNMICIQQFGLDQITCYESADAWLIFVKGRRNLLFEQGTVDIHNTCVLWLTLNSNLRDTV